MPDNTHASALRRCLIDLDVKGIRRIWAAIAPHLPQLKPADALPALHLARTSAASVPFNLRAYSHRWLTERALPSHLPDNLKPKAERMYPVVVGGVGISVNSKHIEVKTGVQGAMEYSVLDSYANGDTEPDLVKRRMFEARDKELRGLFGRSKR